MLVYFSALCVSLIAAKYGKRIFLRINNDYKFCLVYVLALFPFWFITCFRFYVGTDYDTYVNFYADAISSGVYKSDFLFNLLIKLCVNVLGNRYLIIITLGTLFLVFMGLFIYRNNVNLEHCIMLFFLTCTFNLSLNIMKQMVATAVFLFSITYIKEKKLFRFILFMVLAIGFHKIVIIYIPFYFLAKKMIPLKKSVPVVLAIIYFLSDKIRDFFIFITKQFGFYAGYFYNMHDKRTSSSVLLLINITVLLLMLIYMRKALYKDYENFIIFYNLQFVCTIFTVLMPIIPNGDRIVYLFLPSQIVSVPLLVNNLNKVNGNARKYKNILLCLYIIMYVKFILINNMGETLPYTFISF